MKHAFQKAEIDTLKEDISFQTNDLLKPFEIRIQFNYQYDKLVKDTIGKNQIRLLGLLVKK